VIRDPRDGLISGCLYATQQIEAIYQHPEISGAILSDLKRKESEPGSLDFCTLLERVLSCSVEGGITGILNRCGEILNAFMRFERELDPHFPLHYEDFVDRRTQELSTYLGVCINDDVGVQDEYAHLARSKIYGNWRSWFTDRDVELLSPVVEPFLTRYGYEIEWALEEGPCLDPSLGSAYVSRIIDRKRVLG
jgi:hypothetical protein